MRVGDKLRCIKQVTYSALTGHNRLSGPDSVYQDLHNIYTILEIVDRGDHPDGDNYTKVVVSSDRGPGGINFYIGMDEYNAILWDYFIDVKQHRINVINKFNVWKKDNPLQLT